MTVAIDETQEGLQYKKKLRKVREKKSTEDEVKEGKKKKKRKIKEDELKEGKKKKKKKRKKENKEDVAAINRKDNNKDSTDDLISIDKEEKNKEKETKPVLVVTDEVETNPKTQSEENAKVLNYEEEKIADPETQQEEKSFEDDEEERKLFLTRIPSEFDTESITHLFEKAFGEGCIEHIALPLARNNDIESEEEYKKNHVDANNKDDAKKTNDHRGFAFVTMTSVAKKIEAVDKDTIRGTIREASKRKYTLYIRPLIRADLEVDGNDHKEQENADINICYLWSKFRCPYGDDCKFKHDGKGGCITIEKKEKKKQKCFLFRTKGTCPLGDSCPYSHDIKVVSLKCVLVVKDKKDKDCINWKTKGKCRKRDKCPYRHDESVRETCLLKKRARIEEKSSLSKKQKKDPQPLSVRVFGLNYDTKVNDVQEYFKHCGLIKDITFPTFEDSGRSKGYCGILFTSPKATDKACELNGQELHGRWLSVQPGKMYLKQWEDMEKSRHKSQNNEENNDDGDGQPSNLGEFGQKVKKRKKHGFKE